MVVDVSFSADSRLIEFGTPRPLFQKLLRQGSEYEASRSGERFLINTPTEDAPPIIVLSNWTRAKK